jgi:hypothetical protein
MPLGNREGAEIRMIRKSGYLPVYAKAYGFCLGGRDFKRRYQPVPGQVFYFLIIEGREKY